MPDNHEQTTPKPAIDPTVLHLDQLSSEYKILQDKMDKIGAFRFTVKGWSVTLVVASIFAVGGNRSIHPGVLGLLLLFIGLFFWVEWDQRRLSRLFGARALHIEKEIRRLRRALEPDRQRRIQVGRTPAIAHLLTSRENRSDWRRALRRFNNADAWFYAGQALAVVGAIAFFIWYPQPGRTGNGSVTIIQQEIGNSGQ